MSRRLVPWCLLLVGLVGGCLPSANSVSEYFTESRHWRFSARQLHADPFDLPGSQGVQQDEALLVGTRWCPLIDCDHDSCRYLVDRESWAECYSSSVEGPGEVDGPCIEITGNGELLWHFDPIPCEREGLFFPEQLRLRGVAPDQLRGRLVSYLDGVALDTLYAISGEFPPEIMQPLDASLLKLAADQPVHLAVNLWAGDRRVAWSDSHTVQLEVEVLSGEAPIAELDEHFTTFVQIAEGSEAALSLMIGATRVPLGRVRGVGPGSLKELEVVVAYGSGNLVETAGARVPVGARAVVRDNEGDLVYGARAEWEVLAGSFPFWPADVIAEGANHDYTLLYDGSADGEERSLWCFPISNSPRSYTGRIAARVADLHAEVDLAWTYELPPDLAKGFKIPRPGPNCQGPGFDTPGACDCDSTPRGGPTLALLALVLLGAKRRRRLA